jgi:acyl-CoA thioester hydrolase
VRPWAFSHADEVRFADLDTLAHLNNVAFLVFVETARVTYVRAATPSGESPLPPGVGFVIAEQRINYRSPAYLGDRIDTFLRPDDLGRTSFGIEFEMRVGERVIADGGVTMVCWDRATERPTPLPDALRERFAADGARERTAPPSRLTKL